MSLISPSVLKTYTQDEALIAPRWAAYQNYLAKTDFIQTVKEEKYQDGFLKDVFENCLGYTLDSTNPSNFNLEREKKNETDGKKADGAIIINGEIRGIIELKDQKTKNLDAVEAQAFNYHNSHANSKYIIISNFDELRFYIDKKTSYEKFSLFSLTYEAFKTLHLLLSYESIQADIPLTLKEKSSTFEQTISKALYRDFSAFRTHLFENIVQNNLDTDKQTLLRLTQKLCDRIIFILFAEDRGLLRANTIKEIREHFQNQAFTSYTLYDIYRFYFNAINEGNSKLSIPRYNGGLFASDALLDSLIIDDAYLDMEAQKLSDFDFVSDISVNILGHIFEQSLTDLEEMNASINDTAFDKKKSKRKKDGVFYTPEYITRYIVENTLGKLCAEKKTELDLHTVPNPANPKKLTAQEKQILDNIYKYRDYLLSLKILDPACGSGAFLNQALEFLIREHEHVDVYRRAYENEALSLYDIETNILEHNLYGVDINEDAVEIARLSLWLRTAQSGRTLTNLSDKIVCANSLLAMPFEEGSFDVVIGNPPYVALNKIKDVDYAHAGFEVFEKTGDLLALFIEKGLRLTAKGKHFSFIVSNSWLKTKYGEPLKRFLENNGQTEVLNFVGTQLFEDATVESCIVNVIRHSRPDNESMPISTVHIRNFKTQSASADSIIEAIENSKGDNSEELLMHRIETIGKPLKEWDISINRGILTGFNEAFIIDTAKRDELVARDAKSAEIIKPILRGRDVQKYATNWAEQWMVTTLPSLNVLIEEYPAVRTYLESFGARLDQSGEIGSRKKTTNAWFETQDKTAYWQDFEKPKIVWGEISDKPNFAYEENNLYGNDKIFIMTGEKPKYLLAILNSKLSEWYFSKISVTTGQGTILWKKYKLELLPIAIADDETPFINLVDEILEIKPKIKEYKTLLEDAIKNNNFDREIKLKKEIETMENRLIEYEKEIDGRVYALYGLSEDEIAVVEGK
ncbi:MAG TPA: TaqI-like C-terminal specificity domain-containing protein [Sulfurovum sp.]|nr:TaqI-like C-terminal specificity domain-containing protein [Sulfurovum sp.]HQS73127.1 TaqI-like C-terminal specificity domain-containing protein [Sulfurovum sp.]HQS77862.1 TaqI-like C-terminal specificity domain-containing protein [Sulfurovum sp.]HQT29144.1 TaqI-like C-terminal specificity domain-containing protein [Sulfurovum sp.]